MTERPTTVAVLDDEAGMRLALSRLLRTHGYNVETFASGREFLAAVQSDRPDCLLLDLHMPVTTGFEVLDSMASMNLGVPAIVITGHDQPSNAERVRGLGATDYLLKPLDESTLVEAIRRACPRPATTPGTEP